MQEDPSSNVLQSFDTSFTFYWICMQFGPDEEWRVIFAVFDENISWYMKENMKNSRQNSTGVTDSEFYNSNVIYSEFTKSAYSCTLFSSKQWNIYFVEF